MSDIASTLHTASRIFSVVVKELKVETARVCIPSECYVWSATDGKLAKVVNSIAVLGDHKAASNYPRNTLP